MVRHGGRVVNAPGDALLAEFPSAVEAVQTAVEVQKSLEGHNIDLEPERRMEFRIGVNLGDVIEETDGTIYGDGVNIAARMEALAEGGGICISSTVYDAVEGKLSFGFDSLGEQQVKNISKPVRVYRVCAEAQASVRAFSVEAPLTMEDNHIRFGADRGGARRVALLGPVDAGTALGGYWGGAKASAWTFDRRSPFPEHER